MTFALPNRLRRTAVCDVSAHLLEAEACHYLVFVNGRYSDALSKPGELPEGVQVLNLAQAFEQCPQVVAAHFNRVVGSYEHGFTALNTAFAEDGALIVLPKRGIIAEPIHLLFLATATAADQAIHPRVLVVAEAGSRATVVETYVGLDDACYFSNAVTEVVLETGACLDHYKLQNESSRAFHIASLKVSQARDSRFCSTAVSTGAKIARNEIDISQDGEHTLTVLNGLFLANGRQHVDVRTNVEHRHPHGRSEEYYKGILDGRSHGVFNGRVHVHPGAQKTDASQSNSNLLLSGDAEIDTKPQLEIYADDVKCAHGATIGQLDEQMLFYLRSRGIPPETARGLLIYGFARDVLDRIDVVPIRRRLVKGIADRLPNATRLGELVA